MTSCDNLSGKQAGNLSSQFVSTDVTGPLDLCSWSSMLGSESARVVTHMLQFEAHFKIVVEIDRSWYNFPSIRSQLHGAPCLWP